MNDERISQLRASLRKRGYELVDELVEQFIEQLRAIGARARRAPMPPPPVAPVDDLAAQVAANALEQHGLKRAG